MTDKLLVNLIMGENENEKIVEKDSNMDVCSGGFAYYGSRERIGGNV